MMRFTCLILLITACGGASTGSGASPTDDQPVVSAGSSDGTGVDASEPDTGQQTDGGVTTSPGSNSDPGDLSAPPSQEEPSDPADESARVEEPPAPRPTTILAPARAGRISTRAVRRVIDAHRGEVGTCYQEGLGRDPNLEGRAAVRFLVGPDGSVEDAEVFESTLADEQVESCIITAMRTWEFPRPRPRGRSVLLTYPYLLSTR